MPWIKSPKPEPPPHQCKLPAFRAFRRTRMWGCPECLTVWKRAERQLLINGLSVWCWAVQDNLVMNPRTHEATPVDVSDDPRINLAKAMEYKLKTMTTEVNEKAKSLSSTPRPPKPRCSGCGAQSYEEHLTGIKRGEYEHIFRLV